MGRLGFRSIAWLVFYTCLLSSLNFAAADSNATQGGNITILNLTVGNETSKWYGLFGNASGSGSASTVVDINATSGIVDYLPAATGSSGCANGFGIRNLLFSNSSVNATSLSAGNLTVLDTFINRADQNGTATFTSTLTFQTSGWGNITSVPATYTRPSGAQDFPLGYLQDASGNLVFITPVVNGKTGFNGTANDFQAMLPTANGQNTTYYMRVDMACNSSPSPPPSPSPGPSPAPSGGDFTVTPGVFIHYYGSIPHVQLPITPPTALDIRVLRFSPFREASAGEQLVINPLIENPTSSFMTISIGLSGTESALAAQSQNVLLAPQEKRTIPFSVRLPQNMPSGYYSLSVLLSFNGTNITYPAIIRVVPTYRIGEPEVHRQFLLDYENNETLVVLTVTNRGKDTIPHLQIFETLPAKLVSLSDAIKFTSELGGGIGGDIAGTIKGPDIRWDIENVHPDESRAIFYRVPLLLTDLSEYPAWNVAQLVSIQPGGNTEVLIRDLQTPTLLPGEKGEITLKLFNAAIVQRDIDLDILAPSGWKLSPRSLTLSIPSRESEDVRIVVESPASASSGTYGLTLRVKYADTFYDKLAYVYLNKPVLEIFAPPIADQLGAFIGANAIPVAFAFVAGGLLLAGLYFAYRTINQPRFDEGRLEDMQNMERMFDQKIQGAPPPVSSAGPKISGKKKGL